MVISAVLTTTDTAFQSAKEEVLKQHAFATLERNVVPTLFAGAPPPPNMTVLRILGTECLALSRPYVKFESSVVGNSIDVLRRILFAGVWADDTNTVLWAWGARLRIVAAIYEHETAWVQAQILNGRTEVQVRTTVTTMLATYISSTDEACVWIHAIGSPQMLECLKTQKIPVSGLRRPAGVLLFKAMSVLPSLPTFDSRTVANVEETFFESLHTVDAIVDVGPLDVLRHVDSESTRGEATSGNERSTFWSDGSLRDRYGDYAAYRLDDCLARFGQADKVTRITPHTMLGWIAGGCQTTFQETGLATPDATHAAPPPVTPFGDDVAEADPRSARSRAAATRAAATAAAAAAATTMLDAHAINECFEDASLTDRLEGAFHKKTVLSRWMTDTCQNTKHSFLFDRFVRWRHPTIQLKDAVYTKVFKGSASQTEFLRLETVLMNSECATNKIVMDLARAHSAPLSEELQKLVFGQLPGVRNLTQDCANSLFQKCDTPEPWQAVLWIKQARPELFVYRATAIHDGATRGSTSSADAGRQWTTDLTLQTTDHAPFETLWALLVEVVEVAVKDGRGSDAVLLVNELVTQRFLSPATPSVLRTLKERWTSDVPTQQKAFTAIRNAVPGDDPSDASEAGETWLSSGCDKQLQAWLASHVTVTAEHIQTYQKNRDEWCDYHVGLLALQRKLQPSVAALNARLLQLREASWNEPISSRTQAQVLAFFALANEAMVRQVEAENAALDVQFARLCEAERRTVLEPTYVEQSNRVATDILRSLVGTAFSWETLSTLGQATMLGGSAYAEHHIHGATKTVTSANAGSEVLGAVGSGVVLTAGTGGAGLVPGVAVACLGSMAAIGKWFANTSNGQIQHSMQHLATFQQGATILGTWLTNRRDAYNGDRERGDDEKTDARAEAVRRHNERLGELQRLQASKAATMHQFNDELRAHRLYARLKPPTDAAEHAAFKASFPYYTTDAYRSTDTFYVFRKNAFGNYHLLAQGATNVPPAYVETTTTPPRLAAYDVAIYDGVLVMVLSTSVDSAVVLQGGASFETPLSTLDFFYRPKYYLGQQNTRLTTRVTTTRWTDGSVVRKTNGVAELIGAATASSTTATASSSTPSTPSTPTLNAMSQKYWDPCPTRAVTTQERTQLAYVLDNGSPLHALERGHWLRTVRTIDWARATSAQRMGMFVHEYPPGFWGSIDPLRRLRPLTSN